MRGTWPGAQGSTEGSQGEAQDALRTLYTVVHQTGDNVRFGRRSDLVWQEELAGIRQRADTTVLEARPVAVAAHLLFPAGGDLARYLERLARDPRKTGDVRDLRQVGLHSPGAFKALKVGSHPGCGLLQAGLDLAMRSGQIKDYTCEPTPVNEALWYILGEMGVPKDACHIDWQSTEIQYQRKASCWVTIRTESAESAEALKLALESKDFCKDLMHRVPIRIHSEGESFVADTRSFEFQLAELRVLGGRILDVIDPSRASVDPLQSEITTFPAARPAKKQEAPASAASAAWVIPPVVLPASLQRAMDRERDRRNAAEGAPRWIPACVQASRAAAGPGSCGPKLQFVSEVSGIPWMGKGTLSSPMYQRLSELLDVMRPLFQQLAQPSQPQPLSGRFEDFADFAQAEVLVKAQIYDVQKGEEILGQLHQEGTPLDGICAVGLYYPLVDDTLDGGDLEITTVMTGGCGSKYPVSKCIPVRAGTAIVFDNLATYHRMTALRAARPEGGRRMVVAFFVLRAHAAADAPPCTDQVIVNYADKARSMVRATARASTCKLPNHILLQIEQFLTGGAAYAQQRFDSSRKARSHPLTKEGLAVRAMD